MPLMTSYKFGDIVLVPFPFTDQITTKRRPAVVVSAAAYHRERPDLILMAVTGQVIASLSMGEVVIQDWQQAGLIKPSVIKPVLTTIEKELVFRKLGRLTQQDRGTLRLVLSTILGE